MDRRSFLKNTLILGAASVAVAVPIALADAATVHVRPKVKRWINRHRRYLHHHLPRKKWKK
jgi:hypothetical protein